MEPQDADDIMNAWKAFKKGKDKAGTWKIFYNMAFRASGEGFEDFSSAMVAISDGYGWNSEGKCPLREEGGPANAWPCIAIYKFAMPDNKERSKFLAFGYCDDNKQYGTGRGILKRQRKMDFANLQNRVPDLFDGVKVNKIKFWGSETDITEAAMEEWFMDGDRL